MKQARVVIGAGWGDEGKGLMTDYYSAQSQRFNQPVTVIRFCSGANAGHTVVTPAGQRHVFHHFGSGTLAGASTYLSEFFIVNPILFWQEKTLLDKLAVFPQISIDPACLLTTPWDMMINQMVEDQRGTDRHGSCGVGINETVTRSEQDEFRLTYADIMQSGTGLHDHLYAIWKSYVPQRLTHLGITPSGAYRGFLDNPAVIARYIDDCVTMALQTSDGFRADDDIIFEGAQGLLLDQDHAWFPYVTRSFTGMKNVLKLADRFGIKHLDVTYASRCYGTRHGAGPMPGELFDTVYNKLPDRTNIPHDYQGKLRHGLLDIDLLARSIREDQEEARGRDDLHVGTTLAITHMDQIDQLGAAFAWIQDGEIRLGNKATFVDQAWSRTGVREVRLSFGPTRDTIRSINSRGFDFG